MSATSSNPGRTRRLLAGAGAACLTASLLPLTTGLANAAPVPITTTNEPPAGGTEVVVFPQRDFVVASGFAEGDTVTIEVEHSAVYGGGTISSTPGLVPKDDPATPAFDGLVEVNHPGEYGWGAVTPDIRPGDKVRVVRDSGLRVGVAEQTTVANVTAKRPVQTAPDTVQVHGTATAADGSQIPLDQLEVRLTSPGNLFQLGGKRSIRTGVTRGATIAYDAAGSTSFTATFSTLGAADVTRALEAETGALWLGADPAAGAESTIYEVGADIVPGPQGPGNGPLEKLPPPPGSELEPPSRVAGVTAAVSNSNTVTLTWGAASDNVGVTSYGVYRDGVAIANVQNPDGSAPAPLTYTDKNVPPGDYTYTVDAADEVGNRSVEHSAGATATTLAQSAVQVPVSEPPSGGIAMTVFPSRDFTEIDGIPDGHLANVEVIRAGNVISTADGVIPHDGAIEVNHPGGACWDGVTPEVRANDIVRVRLYDGATGAQTSAHQLHVANVSAKKAVKVTDDDPTTPAFEGSVKITGFAQGHDGTPLPVGEIEARLIASSKEPFGKNGRRTLRAPEDGTLAYDTTDNPLGTKFTATFTGLDAADVTKALEVESRIMWLGRDPLAGVELTIYEAGSGDAPGPAAGFCSSPIETPDTVAPSAPTLTATPDGPNRTVALSWTEAQDEQYVYGYRISRGGTPIANVAADARSFTDTAVGPGEHTYTVQAFDSASALGAGAQAAERLAAGQGGEYGNFSSASAGKTVTMPDVTAPTVPANLQVTNPTTTTTNPDGSTTVTATRNARVVFDPSKDDSTGTIKYRVYRDGVLLPAAVPTLAANGKLVHVDTRLTAGQVYRYAVDAVDAADNASAKTTEVSVQIAADTIAPAVVKDVKAVAQDARARDITVSWAATTDTTDAAGSPGLVTAYRVFRNGALAATVSGTELSFTDKALTAGTHTYKVSAVDSANNVSDRAAQTAASETVANDPPTGGRSITVFPARDIVEGGGYTAADGPVRAQILRQVDGAWKVISTSSPATPNAEGIVEINHSGPDCWTTNTPDIRPGDLARIITAKGATADQTVVQDLTVQRPAQTAAGTLVVKGTAKSVAGLPVDAGRLEHRIVSDGVNFAKNGRNSILTPADGSLVLAADGSWTATYTGLSAADVTRAMNGESIINWLGRDALAGNELTITENYPGSDGGPAAGTVCTAPLEPGVAQVSLAPTTRQVFPDTASGSTSTTARTVTLTNSGAAPLTLGAVYLAGLNPGDFVLAPVTLPATLAPGQSLPVSVSFKPSVVGARAATVNFVDNAANTSYQTVALAGNGVTVGAPATPGVPTRAMAFNTPLTGGTTAKVNLTWATAAGAVTYEVQRSVAGGAFSTVATLDAVPGATTATTQVDVTPGSAHRYQVRAVSSGGASAFATGAAFTLAPLQENNAAVTYRGTWPRTALAGSFGGSVTSNSAAGNTATLRTNGTGFAVVSSKGPDRGMVEVWLNGARRATVNLYSPTVQPAHVIFATDGLANTTHSIEVRPTGVRPTGSSGSRVDVDGFLAAR
jgi:hypothetical protein